MKKIYSILAGVLVSTVAMAFEPGDGSTSTGLAVVKKNETTINLFYKTAGFSNVKVSILDNHGKKVFSESIKNTDGFIRPYNFEGMEKGEYTFTVADNSGERTQKFMYGEQEAKAVNVLQISDNKYVLGVNGKLVSGDIQIKIYEGSRLLHQQTNQITGDFGQLFKLEHVNELISFVVTDSSGKQIN